MDKKIKLIAGAFAFALALGAMPAQAATKEGASEVGFNFSYMKPSGTSATWTTIASYGYFVSDALEIKGFGLFGNSGGSTFNSYAIGVDYNFSTDSDFVPFVGVALGHSNFGGGSASESQLYAGVKSFLSEKVALNTQVTYSKPSGGSSEMDISIGFNVYF